MDLLDFFNGRYSPRKLGVLLDGLPRTSHLETAKSSDVELAEMMEHGAKIKPPPPPLHEFTREQEIGIAQYYLLHQIMGLLIRQLGSKKKPPKPLQWATPETAASRLARKRAWDAHQHVSSRLNIGTNVD